MHTGSLALTMQLPLSRLIVQSCTACTLHDCPTFTLWHMHTQAAGLSLEPAI